MASEDSNPRPSVSESGGKHPLASPPPTTSPESVPPEPPLARYLRWYGPMLPTGVLVVSALVASLIYYETQRQNTVQRVATLDQQKLLRQSIDQNTIATIYNMGMETSKLLVQFPELRTYFDANEDYRIRLPKPDLAQRMGRLNQRFDKESAATKQRVWIYSEVLSDFFEYTFALRHLLPESDWKGWWTYFSDAYDESHFLKAYMTSRPGWYTINDVLKLPKAQRDAWYTEDKKRIAQLNAKLK